MLKVPDVKEMMKAGLHFGHRTSKWNPACKPYIYGVKNGIHIFDLEKTRTSLEAALELVASTVAANGVVLFLGTKKQVRDIIQQSATEVGMPYVIERWLGGTLTNFGEIHKLVKKLDALERDAADADYEKKYTKRERALFQEEIDSLKRDVGGIRAMHKLPDLIYLAGVRDEKIAVKEAAAKKIKTVGIVDSNVNPNLVTRPIVANDDAVKSLELITQAVAEAVKAGLERKKEQALAEEKKGLKKMEK